ncbi:PP0621 family protein [Helicobacter winghamensis]|uniref:Prokaryotic metallothionein family protein n=1 Tax=Helicobacter winghamensis TaxID=157268 RepID=A0A2N3PIW9_9HELI|nr:PP0621 family protein [Helicobacter winghamensis]PKT76360.1 hypothetical protein BCM35_06475 [Helicobacter winghamensis]PKT76491.1 hypothetical protein BCM32_03630 [Helicobacter winghamensis]PKT76622.1 hypothetical protein BCM34_05005 [Helicobacter winghamensis]PKT80871.1 hypothetical protein BCM31_02615 [Helicobacter winghamensis]PKT81286.1 hypothetical protein BCM33_05220 [Helicobacter winghamensis]
MLKWIIFILCIIGIYFFFFRKPTQKRNKQNKQDSIMLECTKCGTYVSTDEAIIQDGKYFCSKECAQC